MKKTILFLLFSLFFLVGCTKETVVEHQSGEVTSELKEKIQTQEELISEMKVDLINLKERVSDLDDQTYLNNQIVTKLVMSNSNLIKRQGYIQKVMNEKGEINLEVQFASFLDDNEAPNGFRVEMQEVATVKLSNKADFYVIETMPILEKVEDEKFWELFETHIRFFHLYLVDNEVIILLEQYLP